MKVNTAKLRKLALGATQPGPWSVVEHPETGHCRVLDANGFWLADVGPAPKDAAFIAACSPEVVIELLDRLRVCEEQNTALGDANVLTIERDAYRSMLCDLVASASPNERYHPAMPISTAWRAARELLKNGPTPPHPATWLDCPDCRALSKSGAEPPRCEVWMAMERTKEHAGG